MSDFLLLGRRSDFLLLPGEEQAAIAALLDTHDWAEKQASSGGVKRKKKKNWLDDLRVVPGKSQVEPGAPIISTAELLEDDDDLEILMMMGML